MFLDLRIISEDTFAPDAWSRSAQKIPARHGLCLETQGVRGDLMWEHLDSVEIRRRLDILQKYSDAGVPDPGNALAFYWYSHGDIQRAREIWNLFAIESEQSGKFLFPFGSSLRDGYGGVYGGPARHPLTPSGELARFARDEDPETRREVGENPTAPEELLRLLANDPDPEVRLSMISNPACPPDLMRMNMWVRIEDDEEYPSVTWGAISGNPSCPLDVLHAYIESENTWDEDEEGESLDELMQNTFNPLAKNLSLPASDLSELAKSWHSWVRWGVAENPITPADILDELAHDPETIVRSSVASHLMLPDGIHSIFASDDVVSVRAAIARNPTCPVDLLETLSLDPHESGSVQKAVLGNPSSSEQARTQVFLAKH